MLRNISYLKGDKIMPPKPIIDTNDVLIAALSIVRKDGIESINARSVAKALNCSTKPLFRLYKNMDELKQALFCHMNKYCSDYLKAYSGFNQDYIGVAWHYIKFAQIEPNIFKALFMNNAITQETISNMLIDKDIKGLLNEISVTEKISTSNAQVVYKRMWLLAHGMASLMATNKDLFQMEEVKSILSDTYQGIVMSVKYGGKANVSISK